METKTDTLDTIYQVCKPKHVHNRMQAHCLFYHKYDAFWYACAFACLSYALFMILAPQTWKCAV